MRLLIILMRLADILYTPTLLDMKSTLIAAAIAASIPFMVWAVDQRISQKMGSIVDNQLDTRQIQYLEHQKRTRELTTQEKRDLEYFKEQLRLRQEK